MDFAAALPLARTVLDRAADLRADPGILARARRDPATRVLVVGGGELVVDAAGAAALLDPRTAARVVADGEHEGHDGGSDTTPDEEQWLLLGRDGDGESAALVVARRVRRGRGAPRVGQASDVLVHSSSPADVSADEPAALTPAGPVAAPASSPTPAPGLRWVSLRDAGADLPARDAGLATMAVALDEWHARHPRCPRCGAPTVPSQAGWVRVCTADGSEHYPRTDPAIIVAVVDDEDRVLLGHNAAWPAGRYSTLAGFVEAGESAEHAVRREVAEETAVVVDRVEYLGSQPWPFPASLMLAYRGHAARTEVTVDGVEVTQARWFSRDELAAAVVAGQVLLPMRTSVAYALITDWYGRPLPTA
ncbi:MAG TPA: NAD(+) diphosphatase [Cellulomonas sp.]